jgi:hypothetical protein
MKSKELYKNPSANKGIDICEISSKLYKALWEKIGPEDFDLTKPADARLFTYLGRESNDHL